MADLIERIQIHMLEINLEVSNRHQVWAHGGKHGPIGTLSVNLPNEESLRDYVKEELSGNLACAPEASRGSFGWKSITNKMTKSLLFLREKGVWTRSKKWEDFFKKSQISNVDS